MKLAYWQYAGPAHIGTLRVASSFHNVHCIMHGPLGDDYFNVMRSMLERERDFTPVTASIVDRHVLSRGSQDRVTENMGRKIEQEKPDLMLLTPTCTSSILQEDLEQFVDTVSEFGPTLLADVNHYRLNEIQAADKTLEQVVRFALKKKDILALRQNELTERPSVNIIGIFTLGFHAHHDCRELRRLFHELGIDVKSIIPEGASLQSLEELPKAWVNIVPYRETGIMTAEYLQKECGMPFVSVAPFGLLQTKAFLQQLQDALQSVQSDFADTPRISQESLHFDEYIAIQSHSISQLAWFSRSIDCQNLTGKKAVVFGDATHAAGMTKVLTQEMGIEVLCAGTYSKHDSNWFHTQVHNLTDEILVTDDHSQVREMITRLEPNAIFGTQMERHIGKALGIPCGVISAPVHIQNFPLGYRPFLGYEGSNNIADLVYNTYTLGMEDHLLEVFGGHDLEKQNPPSSTEDGLQWADDAYAELQTIPGFVRGKVKKNTEKFATHKGFTVITRDVLYQAKEAATA